MLLAPPDRIYRAFLDPDALARWLPPNGFTGKVHLLEPHIGGRYRMSFTNFTTMNAHAFGGTYLELEPGRIIRYTDVFEDPSMPGEMITSVRLVAVGMGTELHAEQSGIPDVIPLDACYVGWQESLANLARLVEPEIPD